MLVHGFGDTPRVFRHWSTDFAAAGFSLEQPALAPAAGWAGLEQLVTQLAAALGQVVSEGREFVVIGFSMGGVLARAALADAQLAAGCRGLICVGSPHRGSLLGHLHPSRGARQLLPGSGFLRALPDARDLRFPAIGYWTRFDLMVVPATSCRWEGAVNREFPVVLHPWLLSDRRVRAALAADVDALFSEEAQVSDQGETARNARLPTRAG